LLLLLLRFLLLGGPLHEPVLVFLRFDVLSPVKGLRAASQFDL
jgi:hypothetical protein